MITIMPTNQLPAAVVVEMDSKDQYLLRSVPSHLHQTIIFIMMKCARRALIISFVFRWWWLVCAWLVDWCVHGV